MLESEWNQIVVEEAFFYLEEETLSINLFGTTLDDFIDAFRCVDGVQQAWKEGGKAIRMGAK